MWGSLIAKEESIPCLKISGEKLNLARVGMFRNEGYDQINTSPFLILILVLTT